MDRLQFYLEPGLNAALDDLSRQSGLSKAEWIRRGIRKIVAESGKKPKDPLLNIIGLFTDDIDRARVPTDAAIRHDELLADALLEEFK